MRKWGTTQLGWGPHRSVAGGRIQRKLSRLSVRGKSLPDDSGLKAIFDAVVAGREIQIVERDSRSVTLEAPDDDAVWNLLLPKIAEAIDAPAIAERKARQQTRRRRH